jgi:hypothetical protein
VLAQQIARLTAHPDLDPARKAGLLAQLAPIALRAIEDATLEARVAATEAVLQPRMDQPRAEGTQANARTLLRYYGQFTAEERVRLILAAWARDDEEEVARLRDNDPAYSDLCGLHMEAVLRVLLYWVDISHLVVRTRLTVDKFDSVANRNKIKATCRHWSAVLKGIDSAITRFCEEAGFERDQLFVIWRPLPDVIEEARAVLAAGVQADSEWREAIYRLLRQAWPSEAASKQQTDRQTAAVSVPRADQAGIGNEPKTAKQFRGDTESGVVSTEKSQPGA